MTNDKGSPNAKSRQPWELLRIAFPQGICRAQSDRPVLVRQRSPQDRNRNHAWSLIRQTPQRPDRRCAQQNPRRGQCVRECRNYHLRVCRYRTKGPRCIPAHFRFIIQARGQSPGRFAGICADHVQYFSRGRPQNDRVCMICHRLDERADCRLVAPFAR